MTSYSSREMMAIAAARIIRDDDIVFCGTGISMLAAMAAKHINAPHSIILFETGAIDSKLQELPLAVGDSRVMHGASVHGGLADAFATMQCQWWGRRVLGIMGAAQIDRFGNINTTVIGNYQKPHTRLPGSGGSCDAASFVGRTVIFMKHEKKKFVETLDYLTSPGWIDGPEGIKKAGLPEGGPEKVISDLGVMGFDITTKEMYLEGCYPGITPGEVESRTGFEMDVSRAGQVEPPAEEELRILRTVCDPHGLILVR
jgi:glutaconate CoA-transferase subunit B